MNQLGKMMEVLVEFATLNAHPSMVGTNLIFTMSKEMQ